MRAAILAIPATIAPTPGTRGKDRHRRLRGGTPVAMALCKPGSPAMRVRERKRATHEQVQAVLLCAPFLGLAAMALPGCPGSSPAQQADVICDKAAECGDLAEGVTAQRCAAEIGRAYDRAKRDVCRSPVQELQAAIACVSQSLSCGEIDAYLIFDDVLPKDHPCFEEVESARKALEKASQGSGDGDMATCVTSYVMSLVSNFKDNDVPGPGAPCTAADECPEIRCPGDDLARRSCVDGECETEDDLCE